MNWNSTFPVGNVSVKANQVIGDQNTKYIQAKMGNTPVADVTASNQDIRDHFWAVDPNLDGHHRFIRSVGFTISSVPSDPEVGTRMDGVTYLKLTNGQVQNFYRNVSSTVGDATYGGIYQTSPNIIRGFVDLTIGVTSDVVAVPDSCYGEMFMWADISNVRLIQKGIFSTAVTCFQAGLANGTSTHQTANNIQFLSSAGSLFIRAKPVLTGRWHYIVTYRVVDF